MRLLDSLLHSKNNVFAYILSGLYGCVRWLDHYAFYFFVFCVFGLPDFPQAQENKSSIKNLNSSIYAKWEFVIPGMEFSKLSLGEIHPLLKMEMYLLKINLEKMTLRAVDAATTLGEKKSSVSSLVKSQNGIAGINANFFDDNGRPLGVLISDTEMLSSIHKGGKLLTGVFQIKNGVPSIIHRNDFTPEMVSLAIQSGPRLVVDRKALPVYSNEQRSRRSGIALTRSGEIILFATILRFPGASLSEMQSALMRAGLDIRDAINLDGGGSSQFFFYKSIKNKEEISISGGDDIPSALIVIPKVPLE